MAAYNWTKIMDTKPDTELQEIVDNNPENLEPEAVLAAKDEIETRKSRESFTLGPKFPDKPTINEKQQSIKKSFLSLAVFIAAFYLILKWDFKYVLVLAAVVLIHELGHFMAMKLFKYKDLSIFFIPLIGALASGEKEEISQKQKVIIALAGPLPGVMIGTILKIAGLKTGNDLMARSGDLFIYLNLFNLLPVMPLDGGQIIKGLFFQNNEKINIFFIWVSIAVLTYFALKAESYFLLIIPFFLFMQVKSQTEIKNFRMYMKNKGVDLNRSFTEISKDEYWAIRDELALNMRVFSNLIEPKRYVPVPAESRVVQLMKQIIQKQPAKDITVGGKILFVLVWVLTFVIPFAAIMYHYATLQK